jgi:hypothetical protein
MEDVGANPVFLAPCRRPPRAAFVPCWLLRHRSWDAGDGVNGKVVWERSAEEEFVGSGPVVAMKRGVSTEELCHLWWSVVGG